MFNVGDFVYDSKRKTYGLIVYYPFNNFEVKCYRNIRSDTKGYYKSCLINSNDDLKVIIPDEELWPIYNDLITNYYKKETFLQETKGFSKEQSNVFKNTRLSHKIWYRKDELLKIQTHKFYLSLKDNKRCSIETLNPMTVYGVFDKYGRANILFYFGCLYLIIPKNTFKKYNELEREKFILCLKENYKEFEVFYNNLSFNEDEVLEQPAFCYISYEDYLNKKYNILDIIQNSSDIQIQFGKKLFENYISEEFIELNKINSIFPTKLSYKKFNIVCNNEYYASLDKSQKDILLKVDKKRR